MKAVLLLLTLSLPVSQSQAEEVTIGLPCRFWSDLQEKYDLGETHSNLVKILFVRGVYEGAITSAYKASSVARSLVTTKTEEEAAEKAVLTSFADTFYTQTSYQHLAKAVDGFCENHLNKNVYLVDALQIISMEMRGESSETIATRISLARQASDP